jgi:hypothetical protein
MAKIIFQTVRLENVKPNFIQRALELNDIIKKLNNSNNGFIFSLKRKNEITDLNSYYSNTLITDLANEINSCKYNVDVKIDIVKNEYLRLTMSDYYIDGGSYCINHIVKYIYPLANKDGNIFTTIDKLID